MNNQFLGKYLIEGKITCLTGLHIGGSTTSLEIGGLDNPVIKDPLTDEPYIPGSSLKGKLRSLTEWSLGLIERHKKHEGYQAYSCDELKGEKPTSPNETKRWENALIVGRLFGPASDDHLVRTTAGPTRLIVRDCFMTAESKKDLQNILGQGSFTEVKTENSLDRVTSEAMPRPVERVPTGTKFNLNLVLDIYDKEDHFLLKHLFAAMKLVENSTLGGGGSRGSGQVAFDELKIVWRSVEDYVRGTDGTLVPLENNTLEYLLTKFDQINWPV